MGIFNCDYGKHECSGKPYMEYLDTAEGGGKWGYLCFWHYIWVRIHRDKYMGFAKVDTDREAIERLHEEIWDVQKDLMEIKEALGIKPKETLRLDTIPNSWKELWDNPYDARWDEDVDVTKSASDELVRKYNKGKNPLTDELIGVKEKK